MSNTDSGWRKRQIALDKKAENARELGLDYEPSKTIEMAREAGMVYREFEDEFANANTDGVDFKTIEAFAELVRADALAQPVVCKHEWFRTGAMEPRECRCIKCGAWNTTPAQRTWVGLSDEEIHHFCHLAYTGDEELVLTIQARLKEKNT